MALEQGNVTLTHFSSSNWFCWKLLSYSNFCRCSNTAMINQCFGNMKQDQIWCYDDLMIWWYKDMEQWFIPCSHRKKGQLTFSSCSQPPWKMDLMADFFLNRQIWPNHYFMEMWLWRHCWYFCTKKKFPNRSLPCVKRLC